MHILDSSVDSFNVRVHKRHLFEVLGVSNSRSRQGDAYDTLLVRQLLNITFWLTRKLLDTCQKFFSVSVVWQHLAQVLAFLALEKRIFELFLKVSGHLLSPIFVRGLRVRVEVVQHDHCNLLALFLSDVLIDFCDCTPLLLQFALDNSCNLKSSRD